MLITTYEDAAAFLRNAACATGLRR